MCAQADTGAEAPQALAVHPGGAVAVVACDGGLRALSVAQQEQGDVLLASRAEDDARLAGVAPPLGRLTAAAFAPDGAQLAVGGAAGDVRALSWPSLQEVPLAAGLWQALGRPRGEEEASRRLPCHKHRGAEARLPKKLVCRGREVRTVEEAAAMGCIQRRERWRPGRRR